MGIESSSGTEVKNETEIGLNDETGEIWVELADARVIELQIRFHSRSSEFSVKKYDFSRRAATSEMGTLVVVRMDAVQGVLIFVEKYPSVLIKVWHEVLSWSQKKENCECLALDAFRTRSE
ncbi:hypothetical protein EVAR_6034_1 [Eumeta japonica]|uniref:Uncharacterized protein n=1 Tax=Eumeta variegata TaxID=151549 RepID=A0A4C1T9M1_EUMVA|nr:hypothetical protein EVAR_6034_1 [Eumeta japonica]